VVGEGTEFHIRALIPIPALASGMFCDAGSICGVRVCARVCDTS